MYLLYLIGVHQYQQLEVSSYQEELRSKNQEITDRTEAKKQYYASIQTQAYYDRIAKSSLNKQLPGETVTNLVTESDVRGNTILSPVSQIYQAEGEKESPMRGMSNPEKWLYLLFRIKTDLHQDASDQ